MLLMARVSRSEDEAENPNAGMELLPGTDLPQHSLMPDLHLQ
jgi:hypothetical protein